MLVQSVAKQRLPMVWLSCLMLAQTCLPLASFAQGALVGTPSLGGGSAQSAPSSGVHSPVNLDLSSNQATFHGHNSAPVNIQVGGAIQNGAITGALTQLINPGQLLTPAQFMAVNEVLRGGQTLLLNLAGQAVGGYATVSSARVHQLGSLVVPQNVSLDAIGFNASSPLNVSGTANILGSVFALQTTANVSAQLNFGNLNIGAGGVLSSNLPTGVNLGSNVFASSGMTLSAVNNITNLGSITSAGNLNLNAGGNITNQSVGNLAAVIVAQNVNLNIGSGQLVNSGLIQSLTNININTMNSLTDLKISGASGVFQALNGSINLRDSSFTASGNMNVSGGDWLSKELNFNSGQGAATAVLGLVTGVVNANAGAAHVFANTPKLVLGNTKIDGDPTYVNAGGDIQLVGTDNETEDLAIIASGNITASGAAQIVDRGHNVWLIAGANVNAVNGVCVGCGSSAGALSIPPGTASSITNGFVQVSASGGTGGDIDLKTGNTILAGNTVIDTSGPSAGSAGGNVTLVAISSGASGGTILFPSTAGVTSINSSGNATGANGNVTILPGASSGQAVSLGAITTSSGGGAAGNVSISAAQVTFGGGAGACADCMSFDATGAATGGIVSTAGVNSSLTINAPISAGAGDVNLVSTGGALAVNSGVTGNNVIFEADSGSLTGAGAITANTLTVINPTGAINLSNLATPVITVTQASGGAGSTTLTDSVALVGNGVSIAGNGGFSLIDTAIGGITTTNSITAGGSFLLKNTNASASPITIGAGGILALNTTLTGNGGDITVNGPITSVGGVQIDASGAGNISGAGLVASSVSAIVLGSVGDTGSINLPNIFTRTLTFNTAGAVSLVDTGPLLNTGNSTGGSIILKDTAPAGVLLTTGTVISNTSLLLEDTVGQIIINSPGFSGPTLVTINSDNIKLASTGHIISSTVVFNGQTSNGNFGSSTNMVVSMLGIINTTNSFSHGPPPQGNFTVASAPGQDLSITGSGSFFATGGGTQSINFIATDSITRHPSLVLGPGNLSLSLLANSSTPGGTISFTAPTITMNSGSIYDFPQDYSSIVVTANSFFGNPSQFAVHTGGHPNPNSTLNMNVSGTIANSSGPIDLSQISGVNFSGQNLAILSATDIINASGFPLTINLAGGTGSGGSLLLIAGFSFSPGTSGTTVGPDGSPYTLLGSSTAGGTVNLGNVSINTSGATGGGNVIVVANQGANSTGSITLGSVTSTGGSGTGGAVSMIGNGITVGVINTTAASLPSSGSVSLTSATSVGLSNPGTTQIASGVLVGGTFQAGTLGGAISIANVNAINAGQSSVIIQGGSISGAGLVTANNIALLVTTGNINMNIASPLITTSQSGSGSITLTDSIALSGNGVSTAGSGGFSFTDLASGNGAISTSNTISSSGPVSLYATGTNGGIAIGAGLSGTAVALTVSGTGNLSQSSGVVAGSSLTLNAGSGVVGNLNIAAPVITTTQSGAGRTTLTDSVALTGNGISSSGSGGFFLTDTASGDGAISTTNTITSIGQVSLKATGTDGGISLGAGLSGSSVGLTVSGAGDILQTAGVLTGNLLGVTSVNGLVGNLNIATPSISIVQTGSGSVTLSDSVSLASTLISAGSGGLSLTVTASAGSINVNGAISSSGPVQLIGNGGIIGIFAPISGTDVIMNPTGSGGISGVSLVTGTNSITLGSTSGNYSGSFNLPNLATPRLTFNTTGSATLGTVNGFSSNGNSTAGVLNLSLGNAGNITTTGAIVTTGLLQVFEQNSSSAITIGSGGVFGPNISLETYGNLVVNGPVNGASVILGGISITGIGHVTASTTLQLSGGSAVLSNVSTPVIDPQQIGSITITDSIAAQLSSLGASDFNLVDPAGISVVGIGFNAGNVNFNSDRISIASPLQAHSVTLNGLTAGGNVAAGTNMLVTITGLLRASTSGITIASAPGQDLSITGGSSAQVKVDNPSNTVNIVATDSALRHPILNLGVGNLTFILGNNQAPASFVNFTAPGSVNINPGVTYDFTYNYSQVSVEAGSVFGNPSQFTVNTVGHPNPNSTLSISSGGTIANSSGPIDLSQISNLSFTNQNIAILAATDIINSAGNPLVINVSGGSGNGGNLLMAAGVDFTPSTGGVTVGPATGTYTLISGATAGGSIVLPNVSVNTSGAAQGGNVLIVANQGNTSSGSIVLGSVTSTGGAGVGGSVTVIGNGISVGSINTTSSILSNSGAVSLSSAATLVLSNPVNTQVINGVLSGGSFQPGAIGGTISLSAINAINAGKGSVFLQGGSITGAGLVIADSINLIASGDIGQINTADNNLLALNAGGSINLSNTGVLTQFTAIAGTTLSFTNSGNVMLGGIVQAALDLSLTLVGANNSLVLSGNLINSSNGTIFLNADQLVIGAGSIESSASGIVNIVPFTATTAINLAGGSGGLQLSSADLNRISTGTLILGSGVSTSGININGTLDLSGTTYKLQALQGAGNFNNSGSMILSGNNLSVLVGGTLNSGTITNTGSPASINLAASSLLLNGNIDSNSGAVILSAAGAGTISQSAGTISGASLTINAGGDVTGLLVAAPLITTVQNGTGKIVLIDSVALLATGVSTVGSGGFSFTDTALGGITTTNSISSTGGLLLQNTNVVSSPIVIGIGGVSGTVVVLNGNGGSITVNGPVTADTVAINSGGAGDILGSGAITGFASVSLGSSLGGNSGSINLSNLSSPTITFNTSGAVTLIDAAALVGNGVSSGSIISFIDTSSGGIATTNTITGASVNLTCSTGSNGAVSLGAGVIASTVSLTADGSGGVTQIAGTVTGTSSVSVSSGTGDINVVTATPNLLLNTFGNVTAVNTGAVSLSSSGAVFSSLSVSNSANLTIASSLDSSGALTLATTSSNGSIAFGANSASGTVLTINANGSGVISATTGILSATNSMSLSSGSGRIGTLSTQTPILTLNTTGLTVINNSAAGDLLLNQGTSVFNSVQVTNTNGLSEGTAITAVNSIYLTAKNGSVNILFPTTATDPYYGIVSINSSNNITDSGLNLVSTPTLILTSSGGSILLSSSLNFPSEIFLNSKTGIVSTGLLNTPDLILLGGTGAISVSNTTAIYLGPISAVGDVSITDSANDGAAVNIAGSSSAGNFSVTLTASGECLGLYGISGSTVTLTSNQGPIIVTTGSSITGSNAINVFSGNAPILIGGASNNLANEIPTIPAGVITEFSAQSIYVGGGPSNIMAGAGQINITGSSIAVAVNQSSTISAAQVVFNSDSIKTSSVTLLQGNTTVFNGLTANGSFGSGSNMVVSNAGFIDSKVGNISIASAPGQDLSIIGSNSGKGWFRAPTGQSINITATDNPLVRHPSIILDQLSQGFVLGTSGAPGGSVNITADGSPTASITITPSITYDFTLDFTNVTLSVGNFFGNPSQFTVHTVGHPNPNSTLSINSAFGNTIANDTGPVDLSQVSSLNFAGKSLAILSATDIINSAGNPLTINLASGSAGGGNLALIAGFNLTPSTGGVTVGPYGTIYTLTHGSTAGGSIKLGTVSIITSGINGGGNVLAVANQGSTSNGSITLGTVTSTGGTGAGGSVTMIGNGITVGSIDTSSNLLASSGAVTISSAASVVMSNPGVTQVVNGMLFGGSFQPGVLGGTISIASSVAINAGQSSVLLQAGNVTGSGLVTANDITLKLNNGNTTLNVAAPVVTTSQSGSGGIILTDSIALTANGVSTAGVGGFSFTDTAVSVVSINTTNTVTSSGPILMAASGNDSGISLGAGLNAGSVTLMATGAGAITQTGGVLSGSSLSIAVGNGGVGNLNIAASKITMSQGGSGSIILTDSLAVTNNGVSTAGSGGFYLTDTASGAGAITLTNTITTLGPLSLAATGTNGGIVLSAALSGAAITLTATGTGAISQSAGLLSSSSLTLNSGTGNVGNLNIATPIITTTQTGTGFITLTDTIAILGNGVSTAGSGGFNLTDSASVSVAINVNSTITSAGPVGLFASSPTGGIVIGANVSGTVDTIAATTSGAIVGAGTITGTTSVNLTSGSGAIGPLILSTPILTANSSGNVSLIDIHALTGIGVSNAANFSLTDSSGGAGSIVINNIVTATGTLGVFATGAAGGISIGANVFGTAVTFNATSSGTITGTGIITGSTSLTLVSGSGNMGNLTVATPNLTVNTAGKVTLTDIQALSGNGVSAVGDLNLTDTAAGAGAITVTNAITASGNLGLFATTATGGVIINANVSGTFDAITATGSGPIAGTGTITATSSLILSSGSGDIGSLTIATPNVTANSAGNVALIDTQLISGNGVSSAANFSLVDTAGVSSAMTLTNTIVATGTLNLAATAPLGSIVIGANLSGGVDTIIAGASGSITGPGIVVGINSVTLTSGSGNIGSLTLATPNLAANTTGNVTLIDTQALSGNGVSTAANFSLTDTAAGGINVTNAITTTGSISLRSTNGVVSLTSSGLVAGNSITLDAATGVLSTGGLLNAGFTLSLLGGTGSVLVNNTNASILTATAGGDIEVSDSAIGNVSLLSINAAGAVSLSMNNTGNVTLGGNITGQSGVSIALSAGNTLTIDSGNQIMSSNAGISLQADNLVLGGLNPINAGLTGTVTINTTSSSLPINLAAASGPGLGMYLSVPQLNSITAGTLTFGSVSASAGNSINLLNSWDVSANYNLQFVGKVSVNASSGTLNLGSRTLTVDTVGGAMFASIATSGTTIQITAASVYLGTVGSANDNITVITNSSNGEIYDAGCITAKNLTLSCDSVQGPNDVITAVNNNLIVTARQPASALVIRNTGNLANFTANVGPTGGIALYNTGNVSLGGPLNGPLTVLLSVDSGSTITNNGYSLTSNGGWIFLVADTYALTGANPINAGSGTVYISTPTPTRAINLLGGSGGLTLSQSQLNGITAGTLLIGNNSLSGGININGPLDVSGRFDLILQQGNGGAITSTGQTINLGSQHLTITTGGAINLGSITSTGFRVDLIGDSVTVHGHIGSATDVISITSNMISGDGLITASDLSLQAGSGNIGPLNTAVSGVLSATAKSSIDITNIGNLRLFNGTAGSFVNFNNKGNVDANVLGPSGISISLDSGSTLTFSQVNSTNGAINLSTDNLVLWGRIAARDSVTIAPATPSTVINLAGGVGGLNLSASLLSSITTPYLELGSFTANGGININGDIDASALYSMQFFQGTSGSFHSSGSTITMGSNHLDISVGGAIDVGRVSTTGSLIVLDGSSVAINGSIGSSFDNIDIISRSGNISGAGIVTAQNLGLDASGGKISALSTMVSNTLSATSSGSIDINNIGNLASFSTNAGSTLIFSNSGNVTLGGNVVAQSGVNIALGAGNLLTVGGGNQISSVNAPIILQLDALVLAGANPINAGPTGALTIIPASASLPINLGATSGSGIVLSASQLNSISAGTLIVGSPSSNGVAAIRGSIDVSANYNLQFVGVSVDNSCCGALLTLGTKTLTVNSSGSTALGNVSTSGTTIQITTGSFSAGTVGSANDNTTIVATTSGISTGTITAKNLTLSAALSINGVQTVVSNNLIVYSTTPGYFISITNTGNLASFSATGTGISLVNNGNLGLGAPINGPSGVGFTLNAGSTFTNNGFAITSNGVGNTGSGLINLTMDSIALTGTNPINAGSGFVYFAPANKNLPINVAGGSGGLALSAALLNSVTAGTLTLGNNQTAGININGSLDLSGKYNLRMIENTASINTVGQSINLGSNALTILSNSFVNLGQIISNGATIQITGASVTTNSSIGSATDQTTITTLAGSVTGAGLITAQNLTLNATGGNIGLTNTSVNGTLVANATGTVNIFNTGNLTMGASTGSSFTLSSTGSISASANITATGAILVNAPSFNIAPLTTVSGGSITVNGAASSALTLLNAGTLSAATGNILISSAAGSDLNIGGGGSMNVSPLNTINLTASTSGTLANQVHFSGGQSFTGDTYVNASGVNQLVLVDSPVVVTGNNALIITTNVFNNQGTVTGNPLVLVSQGAGTIANSNGNIDLKNFGNNLTFSGKTLAILASGSIVNTSLSAGTINLSGSLANGGGLNLIAGYNFTPTTQTGGTTAPTGQIYTLGSQTGTAGNINWGNVNINTSSTGAGTSGGNVLAIATGSISLGTITASSNTSSGTGGHIVAIGNGISVGAIDTTGLNAGNVSISSALPQIIGGSILVVSGYLSGGSFAAKAGSFNGNISLNSINAGNANIGISTGGTGAITQSANTTLATSGILSVSSGAKDINLNVAAAFVQLTTGSGSASITDSVPGTLNNSAVGGNLNVTGTNGLAIGAGQTISAGRNLSLVNSGVSTNLSIGNNVILSAGSLTPGGQSRLSISPLVGLSTNAPTDIQNAGSISLQSSGAAGAGVNTIIIGTNDQLSSNGGDITFSTTKQNSNMSAGDQLNLSANGGSININNFSGSVNLGLAVGGLGTTLTARTLNAFMGGNINITGSNGIRIGGGAVVNALGSMSLNAFNGTIDIAPGTGGVVNVGSFTNILANTGLNFGPNTTFNSGNSVNATIIGQASQVSFGNNDSITAGALNAGAAIVSNAVLNTSDIKSSGSIFLTAIGTGGIVGGANDSLIAEGGGLNISAVGQGGNLLLGNGANLRADGGGINIFSAGSFNVGASGVGATGSIVTRAVGPVGGSVIVTSFNGLAIGDSTQNVIAGSLILTNIGTATPGALSLGANSSTLVNGNGSAIINQIGQTSKLAFGSGAVLQSQGFMSVLALGSSAGKTIDIGTNVRLESTNSGINVSSIGNGSFIVDNSSKVLADNGGINIFSTGAVSLGTTGNITMSTGGLGGFMGIVAANGLSVGANSLISSSGGMNITSLGATTFIINDGAKVQAGTAGSGAINIFSAGPISIGTSIGVPTGVTLSTAGLGGFLGLISTGGLTVGSNSVISSSSGMNILGLGTVGAMSFGDNTQVTGAQFTNIQNLTNSGFSTGTNVHFAATGGLNLTQLGNGSFAFGSSTNILVNNGGLNLFTLSAANFGAGSTINAPGNFANINLQAFTGVNTGVGSSISAAAGLVSITNIGAGKLQVSDSTTIVGGSGVSLAAFNPTSDIEIGNSVTITAGSLKAIPTPPVYPNPLQFSNVNQSGSVSISAFGSELVGANNIGLSVGTGSKFTSNGSSLTLNSFSQIGQVSVGDNYKFTAYGGSISVSSGANGAGALTVGSVGGAAGSSMTAQALGFAPSTIALTAQGNVLVGAGVLNSGTATSIASSFGSTTVSGTTVAAQSNLSITGSTTVTVDTGANLKAGSLTAGAPASGNLTPNFIATTGSLVLSGATIIIGNNDILSSNGNDLKISANSQTMGIGSGNLFEANGGNVQMLAKGVVTAQSANTFHARSVGNVAFPSSSTGGGIELGSGLTFSSNLIIAFTKAPGTSPLAPNLLGQNVVYTGNGLGVIQQNVSGGGITNLNSANANPSTLILNTGGVQVFDAQGAGAAVNVDHASFKTEGLRPIALLTPVEPDQESLASLPVVIKRSGTTTNVAVGKHSAKLRVFGIDGHAAIVPDEDAAVQFGKQIAQIYASPKSQFTHSGDGILKLRSGEVFLNASNNIPVQTDFVEVHAMRGALASVRAEDGCTYVRVCSPSGTVSAVVNGKTITLNSGEEMLVTNHKPDKSEIYPSDGLGRRSSHTSAYGTKYVTISDFSIITMVSNHESLFALHSSNCGSEKRLLDRLLKTAATVDLVLKYRGAYSAR